MKKVLAFYALLVVVIIIFVIARGGNFFNFSLGGGTKGTAKIGTKTYKLLLAKTDAETMKGLSGRNNLPKDTGMLFIFEKKDKYGFWMRDMKFPIDIIFISDDKIVDFVVNAPAPDKNQIPSSLPIYKSSEPANMVLELNANEIEKNKFKKGDKVTLKDVK